MKCAWESLLAVLPPWMRPEVDRVGREDLQELRLRLNRPPELVLNGGRVELCGCIHQNDLDFCLNAASAYSPWAADSVAQGYLTAPGGHRIGICGDGVTLDGRLRTIGRPESLCIRVARDFPGIAQKLQYLSGSVLLIGPPGSGKTTLLRDLIRMQSDTLRGSIGVVDERGELFPMGYSSGFRTDILTGCSKNEGIERLLRVMSPEVIAMDEITSEEDCESLLKAGWCGVRLLATAHASSRSDLCNRAIYAPLVKSGIFDTLVILQRDKSFKAERIAI